MARLAIYWPPTETRSTGMSLGYTAPHTHRLEEQGMERLADIVQRSVSECASDLLRNYKMDFDADSVDEKLPEASEFSWAGILGFAGGEIRGSMTLLITDDALQASQQGASSSDWVAELGNQLLGRVKNRLLDAGLDFSLGTPVGVSGRQLSVACEEHPMVFHYEKEGTPTVVVVFDADYDRDQMVEVKAGEHSAAAEGATILF